MTTDPITTPPSRPGRRAVAAAVAVVLLAFALVLLAVELHWTRSWDVRLDDDLNRAVAHHPDLVRFWKGVSLLGQPIVFETLAVLAGLALWRRDRRLALVVPVSVLGSALLYTLVKLAVRRARPTVEVPITHAHGYSFPSGHAMASWVAMATVLVVVRGCTRRVRAAGLLLGLLVALTIAASRLALGVHYPTDVLAGWLLGTAWVGVVALAAGLPGRQPTIAASRADSFGSAST